LLDRNIGGLHSIEHLDHLPCMLAVEEGETRAVRGMDTPGDLLVR
jgi:hypothetical protein